MQSRRPQRLQQVKDFDLTLEYIIIAGGGDGVAPADLIGWIHPVLMGLAGTSWIAAEATWHPRHEVHGVYGGGDQAPRPLRQARFEGCDLRPLAAHLPGDSAAFILLGGHVPQILALLDSLARWLMAFDRQDARYAALVPVLDQLCLAAETAPQNRQGPLAGALLKPAAE